MSDVMLLGVLRMPLPDDPKELDTLTWLQFRGRARQAAERIASDAAEIERLRAALEISEAATAGAIRAAQWQARTNAELNKLQDEVRSLQAEACRRLNDEFGA